VNQVDLNSEGSSGDITGIVKSRSTPFLNLGLKNSQIIFKNASTAEFDYTRNMALS
jgi:hypothetical protein